jgi:K+-sensing histidine kinase KdpD
VPAFSIFVALVAIITAQFGRQAGVIAGIASALAFNFFFVPPALEFTFPPEQQEYMLLDVPGGMPLHP